MITLIACIALLDMGLGFYLVTYWILPIASQAPFPSDQIVTESLSTPLPVPAEHPAAETSTVSAVSEQNSDRAAITPSSTAPKSGWQAAARSAKTDIAAINERIRYAVLANDKQLARDIAAEIRTRIRQWQKQIQDLLAQLSAEHEQDSSIPVDLVTPELCIAQIETLQTNLELLEWSESTDTLLGKLQRELAAINKLLPVAG